MKEGKKDLHLMVDEQIHSKIKAIAAENRLTISDYCLNMILKGRVVAPLSNSQHYLLRQFQGFSNNANQCAKALNKGDVDPIIIAMVEEVFMKSNLFLDEYYKSTKSKQNEKNDSN